MNNQEHVLRYARTRSRTRMLDVDLNAAPPCESQSIEGNTDHTRSQERQASEEVNVVPTPIDVEALDDDDDVIISSPRAFHEAKNNARRNRGRTIVVDLDSNNSSDDRSCRNKRRRVPANQTVINCDLYANEGGSDSSKNNSDHPPVAKEVTFTCPICMDTLVEAASTKCGHIFCKPCVKAAIAAQGKCPTCRKKTTARDIIRIYLPAPKSI